MLTACGGNTKSTDTAPADEAAIDSTEIFRADSLAAVEAARADSIAKAAETPDPKVEKKLKQYAEYVSDLSPASIAEAGAGSWIAHEAQAAGEVESWLDAHVGDMTAKQSERYEELKSKMKSYN